MTRFFEQASTILATLTVLSLVAGCGTATQTPENGNAARQATNPSQPGSNATSVKTSTPSNTSSSQTGWPGVGLWPVIHVQKTGQLPVAMLGNALTTGPDGMPVSVGGYTGVVSLTKVYELGTAVTSVASLPQRTHDAAVGYLGDTLVVLGGGQANSYDTIVEINHGKATVAGHLNRPLSDASAVSLHEKGVTGLALVGGYDGSTYRNSISFVHSTTDGKRVWETLSPMPRPLRYAGVASSGSALYIAGGQMPSGLSDTVYEWTDASHEAKPIAKLPFGIEKAALFAAGPYLLLVGGESATGAPTNEILGIDTRNGLTKVLGHLPTPLADMGYTAWDGKGMLAGGVTSSSDKDVTSAIYTLSWKAK